MELRAYGHLLEELLERLAPASDSDDSHLQLARVRAVAREAVTAKAAAPLGFAGAVRMLEQREHPT